MALVEWYPRLWDWAAQDGSPWALAVAGLVSVFSLMVPAMVFVYGVALAKLLGHGAALGFRRWSSRSAH
jgi:hypothetical protein